jgi:hypothetical protein
MLFVLVYLAALIPVLMIGATLVEMLMRDAPRRGKRPDDHTLPSPPRHRVCAVTADGRVVRGTPRQVVRRLADRAHFLLLLFLLAPGAAERLLERWEAAGRILVRGEWG